MVFDKNLFKRYAPKNVQKVLSHHMDLIDGKEVIFNLPNNDMYGTLEYEDEGQDIELYPIRLDWCKEETINEKEPIATKQNRF